MPDKVKEIVEKTMKLTEQEMQALLALLEGKEEGGRRKKDERVQGF